MDHDRLFKELLTTFFIEFIELFLPDMAAYIDREHFEFLDKEVFTDVTSGERHEVDLLVKARFKGGGELFFLIHIENQSRAEPDFVIRMFRYFARLYEKYGLPIFPIAIFSYEQPLRPEPDRHVVEFPGFRVLDFAFRSIQLNQLNWRDYLRNPNPVANALMTRMRIAPDRPRVKLECLRMLATLRLDKARSTLIAGFMESYLKLTTAETIVYNEQRDTLEAPEREVVMQITNEWIEQGREAGLEQGLSQGRVEGRVEGRQQIILKMLRRRFDKLPVQTTERLNTLSDKELDEFAEAIFEFKSVEDTAAWLARIKGDSTGS